MKILGHPIHIMLVHFPTALLPMDFLCSALSTYTLLPELVFASFYAMVGGVVGGWLAIVFGVFDLAEVSQRKPAAMNAALLHGGINLTVIISYTVIAYIAYKEFPNLEPDGLGLLLIKAGLIAFMLAGNFIGGSLILKHRVAIEETRK